MNGTEFRGVITDWGGVLTTPILTTVQAWIQADGIDWESYRTVMRAWFTDAYGPNGARNPGSHGGVSRSASRNRRGYGTVAKISARWIHSGNGRS